jgi:hypothetical protein
MSEKESKCEKEKGEVLELSIKTQKKSKLFEWGCE